MADTLTSPEQSQPKPLTGETLEAMATEVANTPVSVEAPSLAIGDEPRRTFLSGLSANMLHAVGLDKLFGHTEQSTPTPEGTVFPAVSTETPPAPQSAPVEVPATPVSVQPTPEVQAPAAPSQPTT